MLENLNDMQRKAVEETEGPVLVLAGAGSGKTRVLTSKIAYLLKEKGISKSRILAITFTNKAAKEMKERVEAQLGEDISSMWIGTFHSICVRILRRNADRLGYTSGFSIYDRTDTKTLLKEVYKELDISDKTIEYNTVINKISDAKNSLVFPDDYTKYYGNDFSSSMVKSIYRLYEEKKKDYNAFDFDDLIIQTLILLASFDDVLEYYQDKFQYIFVDEYQDTNKTQYEMVRLLSERHKNVTAVGDNDQSIYGWRGADISNIMDFEKDFEGSQVVKLERNYRSTREILDAANELIKNNDQKYLKKLWTDKTSGNKPIYMNLPSDQDEAYKLVQKINELVYKGEKLQEMAILYRTNAESRQLEEALISYGISYVIVGGLKFYERKEIKDIIAYLTIFMNKTDDISFRRIVNVPRRGIGEKSLEKLEKLARNYSMSSLEVLLRDDFTSIFPGSAPKGFLEFKEIYKKLSTILNQVSLTEFVEAVIEETGMKDMYIEEGSVESRTRLENIDSFLSAIVEYENQSDNPTLEDYLQTAKLLSELDKTENSSGSVSLMTVHSAKGLEFDNVFVIGLEDDNFPSKRAVEEGNLEEERRLFYVAITRARKNLYLYSASRKMFYGKYKDCLPSRFINELGDTIEKEEAELRNWITGAKVEPERMDSSTDWERDYVRYDLEKRKESYEASKKEDFMVGDKVSHRIFGIGTIINFSGEGEDKKVMISFENKGIKNLALSIAPIEKVD